MSHRGSVTSHRGSVASSGSNPALIEKILHRGWLWKHGGRVRNWKKRYFILRTSGRLTYYSTEADAESNTGALGIVDIHKALYVTRRVKDVEDSNWPEAAPVDVCFTIITNDRNYGVYAEDPKEADAWVRRLQDVRGGVDKSDISVEQQTDVPAPRRQSMSSHMTNFCMRYKILDLSPKLQLMWMKWNNVGQRALKALADHFGIVEEITMHCDAGSMYDRLPTNRRTRIGEYIFADYMDELRYNLCKEFGDDDMAKKAFRSAFSKRKIKVEMTDEDSIAPSTTKLVDGILCLTLNASKFGSGIHLAGTGLAAMVEITEEESLSGHSITGMRVGAAASILQAMPALEKATSDLRAKLPGKPKVEFRCDYKAVHAAMETLDGSMATNLGGSIIRPIIIRLVTDLTSYVTKAEAEVVERIAGGSGELIIIFNIASSPQEHDPDINLDGDGHIIVTGSVKKIVEMNMYDRPPAFRLKEIFV